jgi:hypothetical protein
MPLDQLPILAPVTRIPHPSSDAWWRRFQEVVADDLLERLPSSLTFAQVAELLDLELLEVVLLIIAGKLVAERSGDRLVVVPRRNHDFFIRAQMSRMVLPQPSRPTSRMER